MLDCIFENRSKHLNYHRRRDVIHWNSDENGVDNLHEAPSPTASLVSPRIPNSTLNCYNHAKISFQIGCRNEHEVEKRKASEAEKIFYLEHETGAFD